jgi:hypothetical protein
VKTNLPPVWLAGGLVSGLFCGGCQNSDTSTVSPPSPSKPLSTPNASDESRSKPAREVEVSIKAVETGSGGSIATAVEVTPESKPNSTDSIKVHWNGYGFICKDESGKAFWKYSTDLAFGHQQTALFTIKKKVTLTDENGTTSISDSNTVKIKRGVPATF